MTGLVGFVGSSYGNKSDELLTDMAQSLKHEDWYQVDLFHNEDVGLGRVSLGIINKEPQPIWNADRSVCIVMEGEVFDYGSEKQALIDKGYIFQTQSDAEFILHLYEEYGEDFAVRLNGTFVVAIWNQREGELLLVNDRLGLHPLYFFSQGDSLCFSSKVGALLVDKTQSYTVDRVAISEFLMFDHLLHDRTLIEEIRLLRPASILSFSEGNLAVREYWTMQFPQYYELRDEAEYLEELSFFMRQAVARQAPGQLPGGVLLSGGLDSRVILAYLGAGSTENPLHTFTFGIPDCDDARFAKHLADCVGTQHHFFELKSDYIFDAVKKGIRITEGFQNCVHMHSLATLLDESKFAQVFYKGFMGDAMMGYSQKRPLWSNYDQEATLQVHLQILSGFAGVLFDQEAQKKLFTPDFQHDVSKNVQDNFKQAIFNARTNQLADQRIFFDLRQRVPRMTLGGVELVRSQGVVRLPFADNDLVAFVLSLPPGYRFERYLMKEAFIQDFPELAKVPYTGSGLPMIPCIRSSMMQLNQQIRWRLRAAGMGWVPVIKRRRYANYDIWFRTILRDWVEDILLSDQALNRGYFNPEYLQKLVKDHMEGTANSSGKLGALITIELWHKQFVD